MPYAYFRLSLTRTGSLWINLDISRIGIYFHSGYYGTWFWIGGRGGESVLLDLNIS